LTTCGASEVDDGGDEVAVLDVTIGRALADLAATLATRVTGVAERAAVRTTGAVFTAVAFVAVVVAGLGANFTAGETAVAIELVDLAPVAVFTALMGGAIGTCRVITAGAVIVGIVAIVSCT
jgi:hypothetical protein